MNCRTIVVNGHEIMIFCSQQAHNILGVKKKTFCVRDGTVTVAALFCPFCGAALPVEAPEFKKCGRTGCTNHIKIREIGDLCKICFKAQEVKKAPPAEETATQKKPANIIQIGDYLGKR